MKLSAGSCQETVLTLMTVVMRIPSPEATLRREPGAFDLNDACKSAAKIRGSQSDGDYHRY